MQSLVAPKKPPRMNTTKDANKLDAAQLTMSSTIDGSIKTDDNDISTITAVATMNTTTNTILLTRQLSADKATMTKKKHLHFHSPLAKVPMKMMTTTTTTATRTTETANAMQEQQHRQQQQQEPPQSLFANIMSDNTAKANIRTTTEISKTKPTKDVQTMETSNVTTTYHHSDHHYYSHHRNEHHGTVSKAMSLKSAAAERATGSSVARSRLDRGCTSLMYACQHGDISEVIAQLSNKVPNYT